MIDFANDNYHSGKNSSKAKTKKTFVITLVFIIGGLGIVVSDHVGQMLQHERVTQIANH